MESASLLREVTARAGIASEDKASEVVEATIATVAARVGPDAAAKLASALPDELAPQVEGDDIEAGESSTDELVARVAARTDVASSTAPAYVAAVFGALRDEVGPEVVDELLGELPEDFRIMLEGEPAWTGAGS